MLKTIPKILKTIFLTIFIFQMIGLIFLLATPNLTQAADDYIRFDPQVEIPGFSKEATKEGMTKDTKGYKITEQSIGIYIKAIYKYAVGVVGIVAAVVLMMAGVIWLTAGGNQTRIGEAKSWMGAALTGLVIALTSYMILYIVNPDLVNFRPINVTSPEDKRKGCCEDDTGNYLSQYTTRKRCENIKFEWLVGGVSYKDKSKNYTECKIPAGNGNNCSHAPCLTGLNCINIGRDATSRDVCTDGKIDSLCKQPSDCSKDECDKVAVLCQNSICTCGGSR